jgi:formylglycine-generating enzyme required for sulfatase activity
MAQQSPEDPFKGFSMTDGFNAIELAHHISISNDFDKGKNYILSTSSLAFKKDYENKNFLSADRTEGFKERFWMSQHPKNDYALNVCITVSKWTDEDITKTLSKLGYEELSSKESTPFGIYTKQCTYKNSATATEAFLEITKKNNRVKKEIKFTNTSKANLGKDSNKVASTSKVAQKEKEETNKNPQLISNTSNIKADKRLPKVNEQKFKVKNVEFSMRFVPHGTFTMGKGDNTMKVELSNDYWVSETEVTTGLYDAVMETNIGGTGQRAVTCTWLQAMEFIRRLNILTGYNFRMITEAEWEYAARYGNGNKKYSGGDKPEDVLNTRDVKDSQQGALNKPNYLGIYGMSNKTSEWCYDIFQAKYPTFTRNRFWHSPIVVY